MDNQNSNIMINIATVADIFRGSELEAARCLDIINGCTQGVYGQDFVQSLNDLDTAFDTLHVVNEELQEELDTSKLTIVNIYTDNLHIDIEALNAYLHDHPGLLQASLDETGEEVAEITGFAELLAENELPQIGFVVHGTPQRTIYNVQCVVSAFSTQEQSFLQNTTS